MNKKTFAVAADVFFVGIHFSPAKGIIMVFYYYISLIILKQRLWEILQLTK